MVKTTLIDKLIEFLNPVAELFKNMFDTFRDLVEGGVVDTTTLSGSLSKDPIDALQQIQYTSKDASLDISKDTTRQPSTRKTTRDKKARQGQQTINTINTKSTRTTREGGPDRD